MQQRSVPTISATSPALPTFAHYLTKPIVEDSSMHSDSDSSDTPAATMDADSNATDEQQQAMFEHVLPTAPTDAQLWADVPVEHFSDSNMWLHREIIKREFDVGERSYYRWIGILKDHGLTRMLSSQDDHKLKLFYRADVEIALQLAVNTGALRRQGRPNKPVEERPKRRPGRPSKSEILARFSQHPQQPGQQVGQAVERPPLQATSSSLLVERLGRSATKQLDVLAMSIDKLDRSLQANVQALSNQTALLQDSLLKVSRQQDSMERSLNAFIVRAESFFSQFPAIAAQADSFAKALDVISQFAQTNQLNNQILATLKKLNNKIATSFPKIKPMVKRKVSRAKHK
ncbi:MAG: hypothetical protein AB1489_12525 [Acidobacteriota bacterium]